MRSIGISDTTSVDSACHPEEMAHCRPSSARPRLRLGSTRFFDRCERFSHLILGTGNAIPKGQRLAAARGLVPQLHTDLVQRILRGIPIGARRTTLFYTANDSNVSLRSRRERRAPPPAVCPSGAARP